MRLAYGRKLLAIAASFLVLWLVLRYFLPLFLPFLLGGALAAGSEPLVRFLSDRLHLPRVCSAALGISAALAMVALILLVLGALLVRELGRLAGILPNAADMIRVGLDALESWLLSLAAKAPDGLADGLERSILALFSDGTALLSRATGSVLNFTANLLGRLPGGALGLGTGILSAFMISAKLPQIQALAHRFAAHSGKNALLPMLQSVRQYAGAWLRAQIRLAGITFSIVLTGFFLLRIPYAPLWAALVALVDAAPMLGTGTALVPWALVSLLMGQKVRCIGLLAIYAAASLSRSVLEPRLVGQQLGLDPLVTLLALYAGFRLWGIAGMLLAPMAAVTAIHISAPAGERLAGKSREK